MPNRQSLRTAVVLDRFDQLRTGSAVHAVHRFEENSPVFVLRLPAGAAFSFRVLLGLVECPVDDEDVPDEDFSAVHQQRLPKVWAPSECYEVHYDSLGNFAVTSLGYVCDVSSGQIPARNRSRSDR